LSAHRRFDLSSAFEGVGMAIDSLRANKVRAALTILGVAIGVMVVIAMASAITGINNSVAKIVSEAGPKTFYMFRYFQAGLNVNDGDDDLNPWRRMPWLTVDEAEAIRQLPSVADVAVQESNNGPVTFGSTSLTTTNVEGNSPTWILVKGGTLVAGRNFTQSEEASNANVAVINDKLTELLFPGLDPIGKVIHVYGQPFEVIGHYADPAQLFGDGGGPKVIIPHSTFTKVAQYDKGWMQFSVRTAEASTVPEAIEDITSLMRTRRGLKPAQENNFAIVTSDKFLESFNQMTAGFFLVMLALSSVGLMVGGIGVIAIMMISVTERTREIGVRKALGATQREIKFQFLVEAATLTLIGGVTGMVMGALIAWGIRTLSPVPAAIPLWSVVVALGASIITGVFFGIYPASKAAKLDPVEALRYE
jgi:putative ABC transport system permease protein